MKSFHVITVFLLFTASQRALGQYNFIIDSLVINPNNIKMIRVKGEFNMQSYNKEKKIQIYSFNNQALAIKYYEADNDDQCDEIQVLGKIFSMKGKFGDNLLACNMDVASFNIYRFTFSKRKYLLIESIKAGSGEVTSYIIFNLFDITDPQNIKYYPLWSIYGSISCFGDFNNNGKLDFLRIRNNWRETGENTYKVTLKELNMDNSRFISLDTNKYIVFKKWYTASDQIKLKLINKKWFH